MEGVLAQMNKNIHTFIGCDNNYDESKIVVFGAPFDGTTSYRPGARFAPSAIRNESYGIETFSPYQDKDLLDVNIFDGGDLDLPFGNIEKVLDLIEGFSSNVIDNEKLPLMVGGEHLVTLPAVKAAYRKHKDLRILHFDAHADLRHSYLGEGLSHSTVMRRCWDIVGDGKIFQFGIRSGDKDEFTFAKTHTFLNRFDFSNLDNIVKKLEGYPVYVTIDLDVLDSSVFPGTGTPEAGGVSFVELLEAIEKVSCLNIVAADMNELSPPYDLSGASTALACKLLRELILRLS